MAFITTNLSEPGDADRGINVCLVALRWDGHPLSKQDLRSRAAQAVQSVDRKFDKNVWDVKILVIDQEKQYVQLSVRSDYSSANEAKQIQQDLKRAFEGTSVTLAKTYRAPHHGGIILIFGIVAVFLPLPFGILAWILGSIDLKKMDMGTMDNSGWLATRVGKTCGMTIVLAWVAIFLIVILLALHDR